MTTPQALTRAKATIFNYRTFWRWHFYAGLFCAPFVLMLSITGSLYLFKPQVEAWFDRPYDSLAVTGPPAGVRAQVDAAIAAVPGSRLRTYEVRQEGDDAARVTVGKDGNNTLVYVHPQSLEVLKVIDEDARLMELAKTIHGEILLGKPGSILVELAACWAIIMVITGLYLWWPRGAKGLGGVVYPRLGMGSGIFWRDLHAVTGVWVSLLALFLLITGLPWALVWSAGLKEVRNVTGATAESQEWSVSRSGERAQRKAMDSEAAHAEHAGHGAPAGAPAALAGADLDRMVLTVRALDLPPPVLLAAPSKSENWRDSPVWTARSDTQNRPQRITLTLDAQSGEVTDTSPFSAKHPIDQAVGYGIAAHEGHLFGPFNQLLALFAALGLVALSASGLIMWWRKRPDGVLGAPPQPPVGRLAIGVVVLILVLAVLLPVMGVSLIIVALADFLVLRRIPGVDRWLGLKAAPSLTR